jgi:hypothetical protein
MSGKKPQLKPLEARKQLLLVESELNRVQLLQEVRDLKLEIGRLKQQVSAVGSTGRTLATLVATFSAFSGTFTRRAPAAAEEGSWFFKSINGVKAGLSLWRLLRTCWRKA